MILTLTKVWINRPDTGEALSAQSDSDSGAPTYSNDGEVRKYASGRRRAVTVEGEGGEVTFTLIEMSLPQTQTLQTWKGQLVQVRDHRGQKWYGSFFSVAVKPQRQYATVYTASFTLSTVTYSEGV